MRLSMLLPLIRRDDHYADLLGKLGTARGAIDLSVLDSAKPTLVAAQRGDLQRPTILLVSRLARARQIAQELESWAEDPRSIYLFPDLDALPYERLRPGPEHLYDRL